jgi:hypothetical protein
MLVNAGYNIAIVEETGSEPEVQQTAGRTPMTREVVRVVSFIVIPPLARNAMLSMAPARPELCHS